MTQRTILIIASNPINTARIQLDKEIKAIQDILRSSDKQQQFNLEIETAATFKSIFDALLRHKPEIVHFSGHGDGEKGLCLEGDNGKRQLLSTESLAEIFKLSQDFVKCVVLNACYSKVQANAILPYVDCVIGMTDKIADETAIEFAESYYRSLGLGEDFSRAFKWAKVSIKASNLPTNEVPTLQENTRSLVLDESQDGSPKKPPSITKEKITPYSPFLVIPTASKTSITADKHYFEIQYHLDAHWGLVSLPRITTSSELQHALAIEAPNFIYLYASTKQGEIHLDDSAQGSILDLSELADWLKKEGLRPILILVLVGKASLLTIPNALKQQCRFIWCLSTAFPSRINKLSNHIIKIIEQVPQQADTDFISLIESLKDENRDTESQIYHSGEVFTLAVDPQSQRKQQQFRAALLRIMLGRTELKSTIESAIRKHLGQAGVLTYAVTGTKLSCVFDLPYQIEHWMKPQLMSNQGVIIINHPLHLYLHADQDEDDMKEHLYDVIDQAIQHNSDDLEATIEQQLRAKGSAGQDCGMVFHWNIVIDDGVTAKELAQWLEIWHNISDDDFGHINLPNTALVHALCFQVSTPDNAEKIHKQALSFIRTTVAKSSAKKALRIRHILGALQEDDIDEFFMDENNAHWRKHFRFDDHQIDPAELAEWVCEQTGGEFDKVVNKLWEEQRDNYRHYLSTIG